MRPRAPGRYLVAACYRSPYLSLALYDTVDREVAMVICRRVRQTGDGEEFSRLVLRFAGEYGARTIVVEPGAMDRGRSAILPGLHLIFLTLVTAKETLLSHSSTHRELYRHLVERYPRLRRQVTILPATGEVALSERWKTVNLLSVALALAAARSLDNAGGRPAIACRPLTSLT